MSDHSTAQIPDRQAKLEQVLADYLHSFEKGSPLDREGLLAAYPDLADDLKSFFQNRDSMARLAAPLKAAAESPTFVGVSGLESAHAGTTLRYFGDYELLEEIARGGMGVVYRARQVNLNRIVALKMILAGQLAHESDVKRFYAEAEAAARLDHPGIVPIFEIGQHEGQHYFSMAFVEGESLAKKVSAGPLPPRDAAQLVHKIAKAVEYAHQKGIIHRDLKPANVLLDQTGQPRVTDFGLAKHTQADSGLTGTGQVLGTPSYMPPEQAAGKIDGVDAASDVYSLGAVLYCLVTGRPPFQAASPMDTLMQVLKQEPVPVRQLNAQVPLDLETITLKCLEKDRRRRYVSAQDLCDELERFLDGRPILARPVGSIERTWRWCRREPKVAGLIAAVVLILATGVWVSSSLALVANHNARLANDETIRANGEAADALREKKAAEEARAQADQRKKEALLSTALAERERDEKEKARLDAEGHRLSAERARNRAESALYVNRVGLAYQYWLADNLPQSRRILDACPNERRGWEWNYLDRLHHGEMATLPGNGQFTISLQFSLDGTRMAAFAPSGDAGARIWDMTAMKPLAEISQARYQRSFSAAALSADGRLVAMGDFAGAINLWDATTGQLVREFARLSKSIGSLSFSPDGKWLAAARADGRNGERLLPFTEPPRNEDLVVWDVESGNEIFHPKGYGFTAQFSPDGSRLLTFKVSKAIRLSNSVPETSVALFDTADWREVTSGKLGSAGSFAFSADGKRLVLGGVDRHRDMPFLRVVDTADGAELLSMTPRNRLGDLALGPDGTTLAAAGPLGTTQIDIWDIRKQRPVRTLRGHTHSVNAVVFAPDGRLASCSWDNTIKLWDPAANQRVKRLSDPGAVLADPAILDVKAGLLAFGQRNSATPFAGAVKTVTVVDARTGRAMHTLGGHAGGANALAFSANGLRLASGGRDGNVSVWDPAGGELICRCPRRQGQVVALALSADGRWGASAHESPEMARAKRGEGTFKPVPVAVSVWDATTGEERFALAGHTAEVYRLTFSHDGRRLASSAYRLVKIWDMETGELVNELHENEDSATNLVEFNRRGDHLLTAGSNAIQIWDANSGQSLVVFRGNWTAQTASAVLSPDETRLATASFEDVKLWDAASGDEILTLPLPAADTGDRASAATPGWARHVAAMAWTADGQILRAALRDGSIIEWNGAPKPAN